MDDNKIKEALDKVILTANGDGCFHIHPVILIGMAVVKIQPSWDEYLQVREQVRNYLSAHSITGQTLRLLQSMSPSSTEQHPYVLNHPYVLDNEGYCFNPFNTLASIRDKGEPWRNDAVLSLGDPEE